MKATIIHGLPINISPCEVIHVQIEEGHDHQIAKVCYEIGNKHASLFFGDEKNEFITPYNEPMLVMLNKLHGVHAEIQTRRLNYKKRFHLLCIIIHIRKGLFFMKRLLLLQVTDSLFPIGGYSHSYGLETYIQKNLVSDGETAKKYIRSYIKHSLCYTELLAIKLAYQATDEKNGKRL